MWITFFWVCEKSVEENIVNKNIYIDSSESRNNAKNNAIVSSYFDYCISSTSKGNQLASNLEPDPQTSVFKSLRISKRSMLIELLSIKSILIQ